MGEKVCAVYGQDTMITSKTANRDSVVVKDVEIDAAFPHICKTGKNLHCSRTSRERMELS